MYLAVSDVAVSDVLFKEGEDRRQRLVFFVSKSLADVETKYSHLEQTALAFRTATKKLRPYFQEHPIVDLTNLPFRNSIHKPDLSDRMGRWAIKLREYGILYKPRLHGLSTDHQFLISRLAPRFPSWRITTRD